MPMFLVCWAESEDEVLAAVSMSLWAPKSTYKHFITRVESHVNINYFYSQVLYIPMCKPIKNLRV